MSLTKHMTQLLELNKRPHRRRNALNGDWVLVSPHRGERPWLGQTDMDASEEATSYEAGCYLCPGNTRMNGDINPHYDTTLVFNNDFAALKPDVLPVSVEDEFFSAHSEGGMSKVVCFSPDHSMTLAELSVSQVGLVIDCWAEQCEDIKDSHPWIQIFENKGAVMGCSMPHPHCQIWAQDHVPTLVNREVEQQQNYYKRCNSSLLLDYANREIAVGERLVAENNDWLVLVPYWAAWPFETLLLPKFPVSRLTELNLPQRVNLADMISQITTRYDNVFGCSFPYSMGWHSAPFDNMVHPEWQLHAHFYPPLLRSSSVRKFMVGYEMLAEAQRDITPEQAADILRSQSNIHYKKRDIQAL